VFGQWVRVAVCQCILGFARMPIYEYECGQCGHRFEYFMRPSSPAAECPGCGTMDLRQMISLSAVSSDASRHANLTSAHKKAAAVRQGKKHEEHKGLHEHFHDRRTT